MAEEKKKTKAQMKKEETALKHAFTANAFETVLKQIFENTRENRKKIKIGINYQNYNRYIKISAYCQSMELKIFGDGNVAVHLEEFCHNPHDAQIFEYVANSEKQAAFLASFEELVGKLIRQFLDQGPLNWHAYMDYIYWEGDAFKAFDKLYKDYYGGGEENPEETAHESE